MRELTTLAQVQAIAERLDIPRHALIAGERAGAANGATFAVGNPAQETVLGEVPACAGAEVDRAVAAARAAFEAGTWRLTAPAERKRVLLRLAELIEAQADELAVLETLQTGKPIADTRAIDIANTITVIRWYAEAVDKLYDEVAPAPPQVHATVTREPVGVVAAVTPWNFPLMIAAWKVAPALATGNSVVLKPAEQAPLTCLRLGELALQAGVPAGAFHVLTGDGPSAGAALGRHGDVDQLVFTGSAATGKAFLRYAGESNMKRVSLECGGKSPHIVLADAPGIDAIAQQVAWGVFFNQGQVCHAGTRLIVDRQVHDRLVDGVVAAAQAMRAGDPLDPDTQLGTLIDGEQTRRVLDYIAAGRREGARLALGGAAGPGANVVAPTVFTGVDNAMTIAQEEIFGPVLSVIPVDGAEQALQVANDTIYGLAAALWTRDMATAHRLSRELKAGSVWVNCWDGGDITTPFGGYKQSGFGRDKSLHAFHDYLQTKTTWTAFP
jgi:gamma-glutamyl-gamma-aminobutyraldehyde dehydrogenase/4-guanidinobutyraldehyde dehydrogenase/NAD-dependent aldehyde dehydrogenase